MAVAGRGFFAGIGELNLYRQRLTAQTAERGNHPFAHLWFLECGDCGASYGANSCDFHIRLCSCQGGKHIRRFAEYQFVQRNMACIAILHQLWRSGVKADAHVHLIAPARELGRDGYGAFVRPFATDAGAAEIYEAWSSWR